MFLTVFTPNLYKDCISSSQY